MNLNGLINQSGMIDSSIVPSARKHLAESWASSLVAVDFYSPRQVKLNRVTGGFNSVVQVAASYCLRSYTEKIGPISIIARKRGNALASTLEELNEAEALSEDFWDTFKPESARAYGVGYNLEPTDLSFSDPNVTTISFRGEIALMTEKVKLKPPLVSQQPWPWNPPTDFALEHNTLTVPAIQPTASTETSSGNAAAVTPFRDLNLDISGEITGLELERYYPEVPLKIAKVFGYIEVTLKAKYKRTQHSPQKSVDILLDLNDAEVEVKVEEGDAKVLYDSFLVHLEPLLASYIAPHSEITLTPTISLVGRNSANIGVAELSNFDTRVFHVDSGRRQAICAAFDVVPGCKGIIEDVEHFIGASDYGAIHDEYVVERVLRHKWAQGGFDRSLGVARKVSIRVKRDGQERDEDAMVYGRLLLDSLDVVALHPHADLRRDMLFLSGQARGIADRVVLTADGTVVTQENADLGPPEAATWAVNTMASITVPWEPDPELRDFQFRAHTDGIRHLSRPFARFPLMYYSIPRVEYARTEAALKRVFFLGQLPYVFA